MEGRDAEVDKERRAVDKRVDLGDRPRKGCRLTPAGTAGTVGGVAESDMI